MVQRIDGTKDILISLPKSDINLKSVALFSDGAYTYHTTPEKTPDGIWTVLLPSSEIQLMNETILSVSIVFEDNSTLTKQLPYWVDTNSDIIPIDEQKYYTKLQIDEKFKNIDIDLTPYALQTDVDVLITDVDGINKGIDSIIKDVEDINMGVDTLGKEVSSINDILATRFPFKILSFTGGKIAKKDTPQSVSLAWSYDGQPNKQTLTQNGKDVSLAITSRVKTITGLTDNTTFVLTANGLTASQNLSFYNPKYNGVVSTIPTTAEEVTTLTELAISASRSRTWSGDLTNQMVCYAYPKSFGALTSIKDGNGFEYLSGFDCREMQINNESYFVYTSAPATVSNFKFIFS